MHEDTVILSEFYLQNSWTNILIRTLIIIITVLEKSTDSLRSKLKKGWRLTFEWRWMQVLESGFGGRVGVMC